MTENEAMRILGDTTLCTPLGQAAFVGIEAIKEVQQYRAIGTIEECREARDRQRTRKPERKIRREDLKIGCITFTYWCPSCKKAITSSDNYCRWCGQAIDLCKLK